MDPFQAAIEAYEAQGLEGQYSVQEVANQHGV
jgi:transposase-like protein